MTYEYECLTCGRVFEAEQRVTDPPLTTCPLTVVHPHHATVDVACNGPVKRLVASPAFMLKGKGWAKDGYR